MTFLILHTDACTRLTCGMKICGKIRTLDLSQMLITADQIGEIDPNVDQ